MLPRDGEESATVGVGAPWSVHRVVDDRFVTQRLVSLLLRGGAVNADGAEWCAIVAGVGAPWWKLSECRLTLCGERHCRFGVHHRSVLMKAVGGLGPVERGICADDVLESTGRISPFCFDLVVKGSLFSSIEASGHSLLLRESNP